MPHVWRAAAAALALCCATVPARAGSTRYALGAGWTKVASAGATVNIQSAGGPGVVVLTTSTGVPGAAPGFALAAGEQRLLTLGADLYAASGSGATLVVTDGLVAPGVPAAAAVAGDATIATGGTAQSLFGGAAPANGWGVYNPNLSDDLWCSDSATAAANGLGSIRVAANGGGYETPAGYRPVGVVSCVGPATGDKITARRW